MMNVHGIRRNVKNVVRNYSDAQIKVREATSNDPWGPSSTLMSEIADLTYNVVAFTEIMQMIWKRLNDHGRNWRHVYKALVLLEYLIKTGSEKVAQQCKENIFAIQTLKDFQYTEDNKDQGMNVREKSKQLVALLKDDERLRSERGRALKAKERFAQATAHVGSDAFGGRRDSYHSSEEVSGTAALSSELECARPQTAGEEELQLQLALAMSKEEAEQEERLRKNDDIRLQMAISESQQDASRSNNNNNNIDPPRSQSGLDDLLGLHVGSQQAASSPQTTDPWGMPLYQPTPAPDPWSSPVSTHSATSAAAADPWPSTQSPITNQKPVNAVDPWKPSSTTKIGSDPWSGDTRETSSPSFDAFGTQGSNNAMNGELDDFDLLSKRTTHSPPGSGPAGAPSPDAFDLSGLKTSLSGDSLPHQSKQVARKTPESFLGPNSNLVNLDALVTARPPGEERTACFDDGLVLDFPVIGAPASNPFAATTAITTTTGPPVSNPFQASKPPPPTINQLRSQNQFMINNPTVNMNALGATADLTQNPLLPVNNAQASQPAHNPFI